VVTGGLTSKTLFGEVDFVAYLIRLVAGLTATGQEATIKADLFDYQRRFDCNDE